MTKENEPRSDLIGIGPSQQKPEPKADTAKEETRAAAELLVPPDKSSP
jgi:hypothetical protein